MSKSKPHHLEFLEHLNKLIYYVKNREENTLHLIDFCYHPRNSSQRADPSCLSALHQKLTNQEMVRKAQEELIVSYYSEYRMAENNDKK